MSTQVRTDQAGLLPPFLDSPAIGHQADGVDLPAHIGGLTPNIAAVPTATVPTATAHDPATANPRYYRILPY